MFLFYFLRTEERKMKVSFISTFLFSLNFWFLLPHVVFAGFPSWSLKAVKELYGKKTKKNLLISTLLHLGFLHELYSEKMFSWTI